MKKSKIDIYDIVLGQNRDENQSLLEAMNLEHTWFHIKDFPSAHLWINVNYNELSKSQIYRCALELKKNSKFKKWNNIEIIYTLGKNLQLTNKAGTVFANKTKKIKV